MRILKSGRTGARLTRRVLLGRGVVGGAAVVLAPWVMGACGPSPADSGPAAATAAGTTAPRRGGVLRIGLASNIPDFDAQSSPSYLTQHPTAPFYNMLVQPSDDMKSVVPDLAESWTIAPDGKTYTFKLRPNVKFHNGDVLTSADIRYSLERLISPPTGILSPRKVNLANIISIETPDANTVFKKLFRYAYDNPHSIFLWEQQRIYAVAKGVQWTPIKGIPYLKFGKATQTGKAP